MKIRTSNKAGFTLVEIMIVVAIIGLLAAIAIPNFVRARNASQANACINNLRQIDGAKQQYILEKGQGAALDKVSIQPYLGRGAAGTWPNCPTSKNDNYVIGAADVAPTCTAPGVDANFPHLLP